MPFFYRGSARPLFFAIFDNAGIFCVSIIVFLLYNSIHKAYPKHTPDMLKSARTVRIVFFLANPTGAHGGTGKKRPTGR